MRTHPCAKVVSSQGGTLAALGRASVMEHCHCWFFVGDSLTRGLRGDFVVNLTEPLGRDGHDPAEPDQRGGVAPPTPRNKHDE